MGRLLAVAAVLLALLPSAAGAATAGDQDPAWGSGSLPAAAVTAVVTADGGLVVATSRGLVRLTPAGEPDPSYGTVALPFAVTWLGAAGPDVVAVGGSPGAYQAARVGPGGALDPSFGSGGVVATGDFGAFPMLDGEDLVLQAEGAPPSIERLGATGSPDPTFGGGHPVVLTGQGSAGPGSAGPGSAGPGSAGPATAGPAAATASGYTLALDACQAPAACPYNLVTLDRSGTITGSVAAASAPQPQGVFRPAALAPDPSGWEVVGTQT